MRVSARPTRLLQPYQTGLALLAAGVLAASCATVEQPLGPIGDATKGDGQSKLAATQDGQPTDIDCPVVTVRTGASAWQIPTGPATNVRYQGAIGQLVRECAVLGQTVTMRVGVEGRLLVGPQGGPGSFIRWRWKSRRMRASRCSASWRTISPLRCRLIAAA
jgi:hypothetical protein